MKIELGHTVIDCITGFRGIVTGIVYYITGCNQALVVPKVKADNTADEGRWIDLQRLIVTDDPKLTVASQSAGADSAPSRTF